MAVRSIVSTFILALFTFQGMAVDATVKKIDDAVPAAFSDAVRGLDYSHKIAVSLDGKMSARIWLVGSPQAAASPSTELGVSFGKIETGSLVGVIELVEPWSDYKQNPVQPGCYTMRYEIMPADGNHMGVSTYRDYLLLVPASLDQDPAKILEYDDLVAASFEATGVPHPAVLALYPVWEEVTEPKPFQNDLGQWTIGIKIGEDTMGLILQGHGEIH